MLNLVQVHKQLHKKLIMGSMLHDEFILLHAIDRQKCWIL